MGTALRAEAPDGRGLSTGSAGAKGSARYQAERRLQPGPALGRVECGKDQTSWLHATSAPAAETSAARRTTMADPHGSQAISCACVQFTRTGRPGTEGARKAASSATSSAPLWP